MKWKDVSSYSSGERGTREPSIWEIERNGLRISVHRFHGLDGWFGTCHEMSVVRHPLSSEGVAAAQSEFLMYLFDRAEGWAKGLATMIVKRGTR